MGPEKGVAESSGGEANVSEPNVVNAVTVNPGRGVEVFSSPGNVSAKNRRKKEQKISQLSDMEIPKLGLRLPPHGLYDEGELLGPYENYLVSKQLEKNTVDTALVNAMFIATEKQFANQGKITQLREKLVADYKDAVFRDKLFPNPHPEGRYGVAYIPLKDNATPTWSRPYPMQGEKDIAYRKIVEDWIAQDLIERPTRQIIEWCSSGFPVPKKSDTFPWRGVVDVRGPNSQTRKCN